MQSQPRLIILLGTLAVVSADPLQPGLGAATPGFRPRPSQPDIAARESDYAITEVRLVRGGFQPCPNSQLPLGMPIGQRNPDAGYLKCVEASVTVIARNGASASSLGPDLKVSLEGWGFAVMDGDRYDYRSAPQLYQESYRVAAGAPAASRTPGWTWNAIAVTYYDGKLGWADSPGAGTLAGASEPTPIRNYLQQVGAPLRLTAGDASISCRYFEGQGVQPERLQCAGLPGRETPSQGDSSGSWLR